MEILASRVILRPRDHDRTVAFYGDTLGLAVFHEWGEGAERGVVFFLGGGLLEVSGRSDGAGDEKLQLWLQVRDIRRTHTELVRRGVVVIEPPSRRPWGLEEMAVADPDGVRILIVEVPEDHPLRRRSR